MTLPADIVNRALDALGADVVIGDLEDGSGLAEAARRIYGPTLRQLLRSANWSFCRKRAPLQLLADATGQTPFVQSFVEPPWLYAYAWPIDGVRARWLPWGGTAPANLAAVPGNIPLPGNPAATAEVPNLGAAIYPLERPARFLIATTDQYPIQIGPPLGGEADFDAIEGVGPINRRIVLTNVQFAQLVYSYLALEIEVWDELFAQAMVAVIASMLAMKVIPDKRMALGERNAQIGLARQAIREARIASHQEAGLPQSIDHTPDWLRARRSGYRVGWSSYSAGAGPGVAYMGWDSFGFCDGSVF